MHPLRIAPKTWMDWTVLEAVPHGQRVRRGEWLVRLDDEKIREQIEDLEQGQPAAATALELAEAELANLVETTPRRLEAARRAQRLAEEDYAYFEQTGRPQRERSSRFYVKSAEQRLANAQEELKQLEKMYEADDLTEETEEIILKRQRFDVEAARFNLDNARLNSERELNLALPREQVNLETNRRDQQLALAFAQETLPRQLARKRFEVEKLRRDQDKTRRRLADLKADLDAMTVRAPIDGVVYYGACEDGKWTTGGAVAKKLLPGGKLTPHEVFMTVVDPERLQLKAVVSEADYGKLKPGLTGEGSPVALPDRPLTVRLESLATTPQIGGGFLATLSVPRDQTAGLMPGMTCKVKFDTQRDAVLVVPKAAVFSEGERKHVFVLNADGQPEQRSVKTGEADDQMIEIVQGLTAGEKILLQKPN